MVVAEDMLMTSKIWSELLCILCNDYSSESTKKSMNDYYLTRWAAVGWEGEVPWPTGELLIYDIRTTL